LGDCEGHRDERPGALTGGRLLILGCGALAREIVLAMPLIVRHHGREPFTLIVAARDPEKAAWVAALGRARSFAANVPMEVLFHAFDWDDADALTAMIARSAPTAMLHAASLQSAWSLASENAWSRLVRAGGYGLTTALQAALLPRLGRALNSAGVTAPLVNGCYPDVVNAGGARISVDILCGIGNVALVAEHLRQHLGAPGQGPLRLLAGHWDVTELIRRPEARVDTPLIWKGEHPVPAEVVSAVPPLAGDVTLNAFGAGASADLLHALATGRDWMGHVPGPFGAPGGYPVRLANGRLKFDLPDAVTLGEAQRWNAERCTRDGVMVEQEMWLRFSTKTSELIFAVAPTLAEGFDFRDVEGAATLFAALRDDLIERP
jgi:hypothetical protein